MTHRMAKPKPNPKPKPTGHHAVVDNKGHCYCGTGGNDQQVAGLVEATTLTPFHDKDLQECTRELNSILRKYNRSKDPHLELSLLQTSKGWFLAWADNNTVTAHDDNKKVLKALGIK